MVAAQEIELALSPCPNDIYTFYGWMTGKISSPLSCKFIVAGIEALNEQVLQGRALVSKVSTLTFFQASARYLLLPVGGAFGYGVGPKLVSSQAGFDLDELARQIILVPGRNTTAHLLLKHLWPEHSRRIQFCSFEQIIPKLRRHEAGFGLVIHESRFALEQHQLYELADLGQLWWEKTKLPLPLGCLVADRQLPRALLRQLCQSIGQSLAYGQEHEEEWPQALLSYSQEKDLACARAHARLYVNADTAKISAQAEQAMSCLWELAHGEGLAPAAKHQNPWLFREE